jgi:demethylmenaquinone methyltransferase/2-methoxy-6-polyprenyl-1,4-benzoquinol methylase
MDHHECMKEYYERRAVEYDDAYLGIGAYSGRERPGFAEELAQVMVLIEGLPPTRVLDIGCGTGFMTRHLKGEVVGLDQSAAMLEIARGRVPEATFVQGVALGLPFPEGAFSRAFVGNLLGVLSPPARAVLVEEARRVASELAVFETSATLAEKAEQWQERTLSDGSRYTIYRRHFTAGDLAEELGGGRVLFDGDHFVVVASQEADPGRF